jgi:small-conductance mechanosensitive channel
VREVVLAAARSVPFTLPESEAHRSQVWMTSFGERGNNFELIVWPNLEAAKRPGAMQAAYTWAIADALDQANIEVPYPQTDVRLRAILGLEGETALKALRLAKVQPGSRPRTGPAPDDNDAADELSRPAPPPPPDEEPA